MSDPPPFAVTHVIFDVDGTVVDFEAALRGALDATAEHISSLTGAPVTPAELQAERDRVVAEREGDGSSLVELRAEALRRVLAARGVDDPAALDEATAIFFRARNDSNRAFDDVEQTLATLSEAGFAILLATNGNATLDGMPFMRHVQLVHRAEEVGLQKPDPAFFTTALERAGGAEPRLAVSVGDRYEHDCAPAVQAGLHAIWLDRDGAGGRAEDGAAGLGAAGLAVTRIESLAELPGLLTAP